MHEIWTAARASEDTLYLVEPTYDGETTNSELGNSAPCFIQSLPAENRNEKRGSWFNFCVGCIQLAFGLAFNSHLFRAENSHCAKLVWVCEKNLRCWFDDLTDYGVFTTYELQRI